MEKYAVDVNVEQEALVLSAVRVEQLMPQLARRLYSLSSNHPLSDMPLGQLRICAILMHGPRTLTELSEEMNATVSAATQIADRMERAGIVVRTMGSSDRRMRYLQLSENGHKLMEERRSQRIEKTCEALSGLTEDERAALVNLMEKMLAVMQASPEKSLASFGCQRGVEVL